PIAADSYVVPVGVAGRGGQGGDGFRVVGDEDLRHRVLGPERYPPRSGVVGIPRDKWSSCAITDLMDDVQRHRRPAIWLGAGFPLLVTVVAVRSEERRAGKECSSTGAAVQGTPKGDGAGDAWRRPSALH